MNWKVSTEPLVELLTLSEAKTWLKIDDYTEEDDLIRSLIVAARQAAESYCNRAFITQTIVQSFDTLGEFELMRSPVQSITSIVYNDSDNAQQTLSTDVYGLDQYHYPNRIILKYGQTFPAVSTQKGTVLVTYQAGYGDTPAHVPDLIINAVKVILRDFYANRDNPVRKFPTLAERMLDAYKIYRFV